MAEVSRTDLTLAEVCAREPIHIPGAIQPHGALLVVNAATAEVGQFSANFGALTGRTPTVGQKLIELFGEESGGRLTRAILAGKVPHGPVMAELPQGEFDLIVQPADFGFVLVETEPAILRDGSGLLQEQGAFITRLQHARDIGELAERAAEAVASLSGFERVMIYRFHPDWHGEVIAEVRPPDLEPYLGLHYPASDIPEQARRLYTLNWLRLIATVDYQPVPILPARTVDLTHSTLRSVSPVHLEYLRNMGVASSMSVSLLRGGRLWGLIACHHREPRRVAYPARLACELIGRTVSTLLEAKEEAARQAARAEAKGVQSRLFEQLGEEATFSAALLNYAGEFLHFVRATGAALVNAEGVQVIGAPPTELLIKECAAYLRTQPDEVLATDHLTAAVPAAGSELAAASGLLAIALDETRSDWLLWFRPEVGRTVNWAGNPTRSEVDLSLPIQPRKSFALWVQQEQGRSEPWSEFDRAAALELRAAINASIFRRTECLLALNAELQRKNTDLDSFAYIASHDLREPLRGIRNYLEFLHEDIGESLAVEHRERIAAMSRMADRLHEMLEALLHFTRVGRARTPRQPVAVAPIIRRALEILGPKLTEEQAEVSVAPDLPPAPCDPVMAAEVFANLISNGLKYNRSQPKRIEIFAQTLPAGGMAYVVRDNGIGIRERHREDVFQMFRRLHPGGAFGGGIGAGLAIVKAIIERHGGRVWLESIENEGTSFFFRFDSGT